MSGTCMFFSEMHSLRQLTLCLNYFQFILVPDWKKRVQNVPIMLIFPSWKHDKKWWKSIAKIAKSLPHLQGLIRPYNPATGQHLCAFLAHGAKFPLDQWPSSKGTNNWHSPEWMSCTLALLNSEWIEKWTKFFHLLSKKMHKSSWMAFCRFPLTHILPH